MKITLFISTILLPLISFSAKAADSMVLQSHKYITFAIFAILFLASLSITWIASRKNSSAGDFYTAGGQIGPLQNGLAIAGDYLRQPPFSGSLGLSPCMASMGLIT